MGRSSTILAVLLTAGCLATPAVAQPAAGGADAPRQDDPYEPPRLSGFERRDVEEMDRRIEEDRQRWRDEEAARAKARKKARQSRQSRDPE